MAEVIEDALSCAQSARTEALSARPWSERRARGLLRAPNRLHGCDMRTRVAREYKHAFSVASAQFPDAPSERVAELARLRSIAAMASSAALVGSGSTDAALRAASAAARCARDLGGKA
jgi:hypothetical protein